MIRLLLLFSLFLNTYVNAQESRLNFYSPVDKRFHYTGRIDWGNTTPKFWQPGVTVHLRFRGTTCRILLKDEVLWGKSHNYVTLVIDNGKPIRIQAKTKSDTLSVAQNLLDGEHTVTMTKDTEAGIGYLEFAGVLCEKLLPWKKNTSRKIEFIGNSITSGMGNDLSVIPCDSGEWYDQHNAYQAYGPLTARALHAEWHLSSVSGIGLIHSCCDMEVTMPQVYDKINMRDNKISWNFSSWQPDLITIALGQNDGIQDSLAFCSAYVKFLADVRRHNPTAHIVMLTSPMADDSLKKVLINYISGVHAYVQQKGDKKVHRFFFSRRYTNGCGEHPDLNDHALISAELVAWIRKELKW